MSEQCEYTTSPSGNVELVCPDCKSGGIFTCSCHDLEAEVRETLAEVGEDNATDDDIKRTAERYKYHGAYRTISECYREICDENICKELGIKSLSELRRVR